MVLENVPLIYQPWSLHRPFKLETPKIKRLLKLPWWFLGTDWSSRLLGFVKTVNASYIPLLSILSTHHVWYFPTDSQVSDAETATAETQKARLWIGMGTVTFNFFDIQCAKSNIEDKQNGRNDLKLKWICCIIIGWNDFSKMIIIIALELLAISKIFTSLHNCLACPCPRQQMRSWRLLAVWSLLPRRQRRWASWISHRPGQRQIYTQYILIFWNQILFYIACRKASETSIATDASKKAVAESSPSSADSKPEKTQLVRTPVPQWHFDICICIYCD